MKKNSQKKNQEKTLKMFKIWREGVGGTPHSPKGGGDVGTTAIKRRTSCRQSALLWLGPLPRQSIHVPTHRLEPLGRQRRPLNAAQRNTLNNKQIMFMVHCLFCLFCLLFIFVFCLYFFCLLFIDAFFWKWLFGF